MLASPYPTLPWLGSIFCTVVSESQDLGHCWWRIVLTLFVVLRVFGNFLTSRHLKHILQRDPYINPAASEKRCSKSSPKNLRDSWPYPRKEPRLLFPKSSEQARLEAFATNCVKQLARCLSDGQGNLTQAPCGIPNPKPPTAPIVLRGGLPIPVSMVRLSRVPRHYADCPGVHPDAVARLSWGDRLSF